MLVRSCAFLILATTLITAASIPKDKKTDPEKILGKWEAVAMERSGKQAKEGDKELKVIIEFRKDEVIVHDPDGKMEKATYKLDPSQKPGHIDIMPEKSTRPVKGIYEIKGDQLRLCWVQGVNATRPTEFKTETGGRQTLATMKRQK